jgi:hypothetical protein
MCCWSAARVWVSRSVRRCLPRSSSVHIHTSLLTKRWHVPLPPFPAKNVALAGVKSLAVHDDTPASKADLSTHVRGRGPEAELRPQHILTAMRVCVCVCVCGAFGSYGGSST